MQILRFTVQPPHTEGGKENQDVAASLGGMSKERAPKQAENTNSLPSTPRIQIPCPAHLADCPSLRSDWKPWMLYQPLVNQGPSASSLQCPGAEAVIPSTPDPEQYLTVSGSGPLVSKDPPCGGEETITVKYSVISSDHLQNGPRSKVMTRCSSE